MKDIKIFRLNYVYLLYLAAAAIIGFSCYYGLLDNFFYVDDWKWVADAKTTMLNFWDTFDVWRVHQVRQYSILPHIIYFLILKIGGWDPMPFYLASIILRIITSLLLFALIYEYTKKGAVAAGASLIFLLNFSSYEVVFMNCNIAYTIGLFFYVLAFVLFLSDMENKNNLKLFCFFLSYLATLLSHENALLLPIICFAAYLLYNYNRGTSFAAQLVGIAFNFLKRYALLFLLLTFPYLLLHSIPSLPPYGTCLPHYLAFINTAAKGTLVAFIPEGILYRLIFLINKIFHLNSTYNIQANIFLTIAALLVFAIFVGISLMAFAYFFIRREKRYMLLVATGLMIMILNIFPYVAGGPRPFFEQSVGIFPPGRILYYPSIGFALVVAGIGMFFYGLRGRKSVILKSIFFAGVMVYLLASFMVNKKLESSYHYDTNIFRLVHTSLKKNMPLFPSGSMVYVDLSALKVKVGHSFIELFIFSFPELLFTEPPFSQVPFRIIFFGPSEQGAKGRLVQELAKENYRQGAFYFEFKGDKFDLYEWAPLKKDFVSGGQPIEEY